MPIKFEHSGKLFEADTPEQVAWLVDWLDKRDAAKAKAIAYAERLAEVLAKSKNFTPTEFAANPWTTDLFLRFIECIGHPQQVILGNLILHERIADEQLRAIAGAKSNQALAGILSGISKQAVALGMNPREVFLLENRRIGRARRSTYEISGSFREKAREMDWPPTYHPKV